MLALGVSGFASANHQNNFNESSNSSIENVVENDMRWCHVTITVRNSIGMIVDQWTESYLVSDWGFGECNQIAKLRVAQLEAQLN